MSATPRVSVIIPLFHPSAALPRLLTGLSAQRMDLAELEIRLADHKGEMNFKLLEQWRKLLAPASLLLDVGPPGPCSMTRLSNRSLARCAGRTMLVLNPDDRVHPLALDLFDQALHSGGEPAGLALANSLRLGPFSSTPGRLARSSGYSPDRLRRVDCVGPRPALSRQAWESGVRFRADSGLPGWDLGVQAWMSGLETVSVRKTLTTVIQAPPMFRDRNEERRRARLVTANPGFFSSPTMTWALAVLRREAWALCTPAGRIPGKREAERLRDRWVRRTLRPYQDYPEEVMDGLLSPAV